MFKKKPLHLKWSFFLIPGKKKTKPFPMAGQDMGGRNFLSREPELPEFVIKNNNKQIMIGKLSLRG